MKLRALKNKVIIKSKQAGSVSPGGIIIPKTAQRQSGCLGTVVSSGVDNIKEGDRVAFQSIWEGDYALRYRLEDGVDIYSVDHSRVLAIILDAIECLLCGALSTAHLTPSGPTPYCQRCAR